MQAKFENVDDVTCAGKSLRRRESHETPILVVIVEAGIENSCNAKAPRPRHQSIGSYTPLRTCERQVITGRDLPLFGKLSSNQQRVNAVRVGRTVQFTGDNTRQ